MVSRFLISNKILITCFEQEVHISEVVARGYLINMKCIIENYLFTAEIHCKSDTYLFKKSLASLSAEGCCHFSCNLSDIELDLIFF